MVMTTHQNVSVETILSLLFYLEYDNVLSQIFQIQRQRRIFWFSSEKYTNSFFAVIEFFSNKSEKRQTSYLIPVIRSFRAQIAVNSLLSMVSSLFKSNTCKKVKKKT